MVMPVFKKGKELQSYCVPRKGDPDGLGEWESQDHQVDQDAGAQKKGAAVRSREMGGTEQVG